MSVKEMTQNVGHFGNWHYADFLNEKMIFAAAVVSLTQTYCDHTKLSRITKKLRDTATSTSIAVSFVLLLDLGTLFQFCTFMHLW